MYGVSVPMCVCVDKNLVESRKIEKDRSKMMGKVYLTFPIYYVVLEETVL